MNILAVDDERPALRALERALGAVVPGAEVAGFLSANEALEYAGSHQVDVALLDIEMDELSGLHLAKRLKDIYGDTNIIFVTGHSSYALNAFELHASGFLTKPVDAAQLARELEDLRNPVAPPDKGVRIQCFGNFEVFVDGRPVEFRRKKAKEILAYLVDRQGAGVTSKELAAVLWEDEPYTRTLQSHLRTLLAEMMRALRAAGAGQIVVKQYNSYALDTAKVRCDYYQFCAGDAKGVNAYRGEYMSNYSWGEFVVAFLDNQ